jgi:hypothetical protein
MGAAQGLGRGVFTFLPFSIKMPHIYHLVARVKAFQLERRPLRPPSATIDFWSSKIYFIIFTPFSHGLQ